NTSMQPLVAYSEAKSAFYYIAKYCAKNPYEVARLLALVLQSDKEYKQYGSKAADNGSSTRTAKCVLQKTQNKAAIIEAGDQQCAALALGLQSFFSSVEFGFVPISEGMKHYHDSQKNNESDNDSEIESEIESEDESEIESENDLKEQLEYKSKYIFDDDEDDDEDGCIEESFNEILNTEANTGKAIGISHYDKYLNRGKELENLCLYVYSAIIKSTSLPKTKKKPKPKDTKCRGRPLSTTFNFQKNSKPAKCLIQKIRALPVIPRLTGGPPPAYPGNPPDQDEYSENSQDKDSEYRKKYYKWSKKAQKFVEYYSLLFLPLKIETGLPFEPTKRNINILPWNENSWDNFWTVFGSWDVPIKNNDPPSTKFYKRSMWQIFKNMVDNIRQGNGDRRLLRDWRFKSAKPRPDDVLFENNQTRCYDNNNIDDNNINAIAEVYLATLAANKSRNQKGLKQMNDYLQKQLEKMQKIDKHDDYKIQQNDFEEFTIHECKQLAKNLRDKKSAEDQKIIVCLFS
ncbi:MAG: hypothetical protein GY739_10950, partial [Mesoflavibacter sp.]|nr:hypothetical protein [Mesoflavibacter sp.]